MKFYRNIKIELKRLPWLFAMILFSSTLLLSGCQSRPTSNRKPETGTYYTCSMHPQVHQDKPGNCPICGMKLIRVTSSDLPKESLDSSLSYLTEPVNQTVVGSFKVIEPAKTNPTDTITVEGYIGFDERDVNTVNTRVTGRVEKLYVNYTNQHIKKGQALMDIYSPELVSAERNLLQTVQDKDTALIAGLKEQLLNLGMRPSEIQKIIQRRQPLVKITLYSPYSGISRQTPVGQRTAMDNRMQNMGSGTMGSTTSAMQSGISMGRSPSSVSAKSSTPERLNIRNGMYVNMGQTVFTVQNISRTWAILNVFTRDLWRIHPGDAVSLYTDANPTHILKGRVDFIPPYRSSDEKTTRIRIYLNHLPQSWRIGTLIHSHVAIRGEHNSVYVPLSAVNRLGTTSVIWVQDKQHANVFHAREVRTGIQTSESIQIISGVHPGDKIAENAAYMVDSDSFIQ